MNTQDKLPERARFNEWLNHIEPFRTTTEVKAAWEGWQAHAADAARAQAQSGEWPTNDDVERAENARRAYMFNRDDPSTFAIDGMRAALLAAAPQPQAAEPVAWMHNAKGAAFVISRAVKELWLNAKPSHVEHYTIPLYAHPQPAQDAKDAARYRHMIEASPFMCFGASEYRKKSDLDEAIDDSIAAMAKESGR